MGDDLYGGGWDNEYCNILSEPYNVSFNNDQLLDPTNYDISVTRPEDDYERHIVFHNMAEHPVTEGVSNFWVHGTCSFVVNNPDAVEIVMGDDDTYSDRYAGYPKGSYPPALVALEHGSGRIIFSGDCSGLKHNVYDNWALLWNIFDWLAGNDARAQWTFMAYFCADNNLESNGIDDLNEMEVAGSTPDINIVVQLDGFSGDWSNTKRYYVTKDPNGYDEAIVSTLISELDDLNMGHPDTLIDFVEWAKRTYPADHFALILWDHGKGWKSSDTPLKGVCDDWSNNDILTQPEIRRALSQVTDGGTDKLDIVGFDACLMGMLEIDYDIMPYAEYRIGSEETEPLDGWDYEASLLALTNTPSMTPPQLGAQIVNDYGSAYIGGGITLSAVDLDGIQALASATNTLATNLLNKANIYCTEIRTSRKNVEHYDDSSYVDLYHFSQLIKSKINDPVIQASAQNVMSAITNALVAEIHSPPHANSHGISIYYPSILREYIPTYETEVLLSADTNWDEFIRSSFTCVPPSKGALSTPSNPDSNAMMLPLTQYNMSKAEELSVEAQDLLSQAQGQGSDISSIEELIRKAEEFLALARENFTGGNYIAANIHALKAIEAYEEIIELIKDLLD